MGLADSTPIACLRRWEAGACFLIASHAARALPVRIIRDVARAATALIRRWHRLRITLRFQTFRAPARRCIVLAIVPGPCGTLLRSLIALASGFTRLLPGVCKFSRPIACRAAGFTLPFSRHDRPLKKKPGRRRHDPRGRKGSCQNGAGLCVRFRRQPNRTATARQRRTPLHVSEEVLKDYSNASSIQVGA
jgi:hypothetical protein